MDSDSWMTSWAAPPLRPAGWPEPPTQQPRAVPLSAFAHRRRQAEEIVARARHEAADLLARAAREGHAEGRREGVRAAREQAEGSLRAAEAALAAVEQDLARDLDLAWDAVVERALGCLDGLALDLAEGLYVASVSTPRGLAGAVRRALAVLPRATAPVCRVAPPAAEGLRGAVPGHVRVEADPDLETGDFLLATEHGTVDGHVRARLGHLAAQMEAAS